MIPFISYLILSIWSVVTCDCVSDPRVPAAARVCLHMSGSFSFLTTESDIARWVNRCHVGKQNDCLKSPTEEDLGYYYVSYIILNVRSVDSAHM